MQRICSADVTKVFCIILSDGNTLWVPSRINVLHEKNQEEAGSVGECLQRLEKVV